MSDILKLEGILVLAENAKQQFTQAFSEFLKIQNVEFCGNIGDNYVKTGKDLPEIPIDSVNLSNRIKKILYRQRIFDLSELSTYFEEDIRSFTGLGEVAYMELLSVLEGYGIHPVSYLKETTDFKGMSLPERKELHMKNIRTLEEIYALSDAEIARIFYCDTHIYNKLVKRKQEQFKKTNTED